MKKVRMKPLLLCTMALLTASTSNAIVTPPLPPASETVPVATSGLPVNSPPTQALIDQLFDKASYADFDPQTPSSLDMGGD